MPLISHSTYRAPFLLGGAHLQTIYPSYFTKPEPVDYQRETMATPDNDYLYLDWSYATADRRSCELVVICHGLCGGTRRHYVTSVVRAFNETGIDALAWNYRGTGRVDNATPLCTTSDSTNEVGWVVEHAIAYGYRKLYLVGFSMGANLVMLYLGREHARLPAEVRGGIGVCGTIDLPVCTRHIENELFGLYQKHFVQDLCMHMRKKHEQCPGFSIEGIDRIHTFTDFDNRFTAPIMGYRDAHDYYCKASACRHLAELDRPALLIQPLNDPFLDGQCYPVETARQSPWLYLEMPRSGGHCGFITGGRKTWWPAWRSRQFAEEKLRS